jgi:hypothetical protein
MWLWGCASGVVKGRGLVDAVALVCYYHEHIRGVIRRMVPGHVQAACRQLTGERSSYCRGWLIQDVLWLFTESMTIDWTIGLDATLHWVVYE